MVVFSGREDRHQPTDLYERCAFQMGEVLYFFHWSSQEPVAWVLKRSGLVRWLVGHKPATPDPLTISKQGQSRWWDRETDKLLGCERTRYFFSGLMKKPRQVFTTYKTYFTFYCVKPIPGDYKNVTFLWEAGECNPVSFPVKHLRR